MDDYDDNDDLATSSKRSGALLGLKLRPWEASGVRLAKSEVSLIDFTDDSFSSTTPSPLTDPQQDTLKVSVSAIPTFTTRGPQENDIIIAKEPSILNSCFFLNAGLLASCCANDKTSISLLLIDSPTLMKSTFHTPTTFSTSPQDTPSILDWPLPQPSYDEVTADPDDQSEDQEVQSINKRLMLEDAAVGATASAVASRSESQSADLFQELQREVQWSLFIVSFLLLSVSHVSMYCAVLEIVLVSSRTWRHFTLSGLFSDWIDLGSLKKTGQDAANTVITR